MKEGNERDERGGGGKEAKSNDGSPLHVLSITNSILRSGGAGAFFDSMRSVDFDQVALGLNETATREKLSVQWPSSRGRADAVTIPSSNEESDDDEL